MYVYYVRIYILIYNIFTSFSPPNLLNMYMRIYFHIYPLSIYLYLYFYLYILRRFGGENDAKKKKKRSRAAGSRCCHGGLAEG